jgi:hypothetical protein
LISSMNWSSKSLMSSKSARRDLADAEMLTTPNASARRMRLLKSKSDCKSVSSANSII